MARPLLERGGVSRSTMNWLVSGPCLVRQKIQGGGWCTFASSAVLEGCMMFHFARFGSHLSSPTKFGPGAAPTVSTLVQVVHRAKRPPATSALLDGISLARVQATIGKVAAPNNQLLPGPACSLPA
jgi:hypothetical protein